MTEQTKTPPEGGGVQCQVAGCLLAEPGGHLATKISEQLGAAAKFSPSVELHPYEENQKRRTALRRIIWLNITSMALSLLSLAMALS